MEVPLNLTNAPTLENSKIIETEIDDLTKLIFTYNNKMILFNVTQKSVPSKNYELYLSLEQLYKINKYFINFDSTEEIVKGLEKSIKQKKTNIKCDKKKCYISILNPISEKIFDLSLDLKESDLKTRVSNLESIIIEQNNKIKFLEEKLKKLEAKFDVEEKKEKKVKKERFFSVSEIVDNDEETNLLLEWLPKKPKKLNLLLNSNKDGSSTKVFKSKIKNKCPTYALIKTTDGIKFGGYATQLWTEGEIKDNDAFVFSLDNKKKYEIVKPEKALGFGIDSWWGFGFSDNAIVIIDKCTSSKGNWVDNKTYNIPKEDELNGGKGKYFMVKSFEIYLVEY